MAKNFTTDKPGDCTNEKHSAAGMPVQGLSEHRFEPVAYWTDSVSVLIQVGDREQLVAQVMPFQLLKCSHCHWHALSSIIEPGIVPKDGRLVSVERLVFNGAAERLQAMKQMVEDMKSSMMRHMQAALKDVR